MAANKKPAKADDPVDVLFVLHPGFNLLDFAGPCEVFASALHDPKDPSLERSADIDTTTNCKKTASKAFEITIAGQDDVLSGAGPLVKAQLSYRDAYENMRDFDMMVIVGGNLEKTLKEAGDPTLKEDAQPFQLIKAFAELQEDDPTRERTLLAVCTGSIFLARVGVLAGLKCTTHADYITKLEIVCSQTTQRELDRPADVVEKERYVVENPRFDIAGNDDPYVRRRSEVGSRPIIHARKGSMSFKSSGRRESITRREELRLGGLRVITTAGVTAGIDAALYMVSALVSLESAKTVARALEHDWKKGCVVSGVDV